MPTSGKLAAGSRPVLGFASMPSDEVVESVEPQGLQATFAQISASQSGDCADSVTALHDAAAFISSLNLPLRFGDDMSSPACSRIE
jgi:hypothetical protein